jgi:predicted MPP superfamily phosphohydrolase
VNLHLPLAEVDFIWWWLAPWSLVLFLGACAGHIAVQVYLLNWYLGWPSSRLLSRIIRKLNTVLVFGGPVLFWWAFARGLGGHLDSFGDGLLLGYTIFCWGAGFVIAPVLAVLYWLRRRNNVLITNHSEVVDIAKEFGYKPFGRGRHLYTAHLPGNEIFQVEFAERHLRIPGLPEVWEGLTILHLSDLHFRGIPDRNFFQKVMERCAAWQPELLALTGDIVDSKRHHRWVVPVLGRLRWQIEAFAILGNHDQWYDAPLVRRRLRKLRMHVLGNGWESALVRGQPMTIIGHEGPWFTPSPDLTGCPEGFRLLLSHTPDNIAWARRHRVNLMLSGHNHGGQIRFPLIGSVYVPSRYGRRYDCGLFAEGPTVLHVSRGLGGQHPVRFRCRPEVTLLVLHQA